MQGKEKDKEKTFKRHEISLQGRSLLESVNVEFGSPVCAFVSTEKQGSY